MIKTACLGSSLLAMALAVTPQWAEAKPTKQTDCTGILEMNVVSLEYTGPGKLVLIVEYENTSNQDYRLAVYDGGANGRDTFLVDNEGVRWVNDRPTRQALSRQVFLHGMKTKVTYQFAQVSGGNDVKSVAFVNWLHLLKPTGMSLGQAGYGGFCKFDVRDIEVTKR
jgi:hypothetical protein